MTMFTRSGDLFSPTPQRSSMLDTLPVGNYIVVETMTGLKFQQVESFPAAGHMYGNITRRAQRIMDTFLDRPRSTGVLLEGEKGSGKSQLARLVSELGYAQNIPTILVNAPFCGDAFNALIGSIEQPAIVLFDEFEKVYSDDEAQEAILTLLDGMMTTQKLFILTVNNKYKVNDHMKNRPGRLFYNITFTGLEAEFIRDYCEDNLKDDLKAKDEVENILKVSALFKAFNFDMLKALVEEMNRYDEGAFEALELLNAKPMDLDTSGGYTIDITTKSGFEAKQQEANETPSQHQQGRVGLYASFTLPKGKDALKKFARDLSLPADYFDDDEKTHDHHVVIWNKHLTRLDVDAGTFEYVDPQGTRYVFKRKAAQNQDLRDYIGMGAY